MRVFMVAIRTITRTRGRHISLHYTADTFHELTTSFGWKMWRNMYIFHLIQVYITLTHFVAPPTGDSARAVVEVPHRSGHTCVWCIFIRQYGRSERGRMPYLIDVKTGWS